ncbi:hypothetical protein SEVIR_9G202455v4 [Setaria viridis]
MSTLGNALHQPKQGRWQLSPSADRFAPKRELKAPTCESKAPMCESKAPTCESKAPTPESKAPTCGVEGTDARVESADVRIEGADVGGGGVGRGGAGVTGRDEVDLKVRVPRRRQRAVAARQGAAGVRVEGVRHHRRLGFPLAPRCGEGGAALPLRVESLYQARACAGTQTHSALTRKL